MTISRREFMKWASAGAGAATLAGCATGSSGSAGRVVVVGGGYGGATAAKFVKMWAPDIDVTLIETNDYFVSCPISNLVIGGNAQMNQITFSYDGLRSRGIRVIKDTAIALDGVKKEVTLASGGSVPYDRVIVSPGVDFLFEQIPALNTLAAQAARINARRRGLCAADPDGAVSLPARTL